MPRSNKKKSPLKPPPKMPPSVVQKPAFTGLCTIDSILNISRVMGFEEEIIQHPLCSHKLRCRKCIFRSAICKMKSGKGNKTYIELPEIRHNLEMFLGEIFCITCFESFDSQEELENHKKTLLHPIQPQPFKKSLDNLFLSLNLSNWTKISITCSVCGDEMNTNQKAYLIIKSQRKQLDCAFNDTITSMINAHHLKHKKCSDGSFKAVYPKESVQN